MTPLENHEKTTFRAFLETKGPRDPPWMQERQILFRIALTRALYDQTAPQLCLFYVPGLVIEKSRSRARARRKIVPEFRPKLVISHLCLNYCVNLTYIVIFYLVVSPKQMNRLGKNPVVRPENRVFGRSKPFFPNSVSLEGSSSGKKDP